MKKFVLMTVCASLAVAFSQATVAAEAKKTITIAAQEPGGSFYTYSATLMKIIESNTPYKVEIIPRGGAIANPSVIDMGKADFGFATGNAAVWAKNGLDEVYKGKKHNNIRVVINDMQFGYQHMLARTAYVKQTSQDTLDKMLTSKNLPRIVMKPAGSQDPVIASLVLEEYKMTMDDLRKANRLTQIGSSQIPDNLRDEKSDLFFVNAPVGQASIAEAMMTLDLTFIPFSDKVLASLRAMGMPTLEIPANTYKGQTKPYRAPASTTVLLAGTHVPDEVVYAVTKALNDNVAAIQEAHPPIKEWNPQNSVKKENLLLPLHTGAEKFYKEKGWVK